MTGKVHIRFENCPLELWEEVPGTFLWAQITYNTLRVSRDESDNGEIELASMDSDGRWLYEGKPYTDIVIFSEKTNEQVS